MGNSSCHEDSSATQSRVEPWHESATRIVHDIVMGLREEEVTTKSRSTRDIPANRRATFPGTGDEQASFFTTPSGVFSSRHSREVIADTTDTISVKFTYDSLKDALRLSQQYQKPVFYVDTEIPGDPAPTGHHVLSHPLIVEAVETLFVTVAPPEIYQAEHIKIHLLNEDGQDLVDSTLELLSLPGIISAMMGALEAYKIPIPAYLHMLFEQTSGRTRLGRGGVAYKVEKRAIFGMPDARHGEVAFACLDGVIGTRTGHVGKQPVCQVAYNSSKLPVGKMIRFALEQDVANVLYYKSNDESVAVQMEINRIRPNTDLVKLEGTFEPDENSKHALRQTVLKYMPLTALQSTRANSYVAMGHFDKVPEEILSPRQGMLLRRLLHTTRKENFVEAVDVPIREAWKRLPIWVIDQLTSPSFRERRSIAM